MTMTFDEPILSAHDEETLSRAIEAGLLARHALEGRLPQAGASEAELAELHRQGEAAFVRLVSANLRLVSMVTNPIARRSGLDRDDLFQEGVVGLVEAARRFDHTRGARFATFALPWIRLRVGERAVTRFGDLGLPPRLARRWVALRASQDALRGRLGRLPTADEVARESGLPLAQVRELLNYRPPTCVEVELLGARPGAALPPVSELSLARLLRVLSREDRALLSRLYGLAEHPAMSYDEVAVALDMSASTVRRRERAALGRLRGALSGQGAAA